MQAANDDSSRAVATESCAAAAAGKCAEMDGSSVCRRKMRAASWSLRRRVSGDAITSVCER